MTEMKLNDVEENIRKRVASDLSDELEGGM